MNNLALLQQRAQALQMHGPLAHGSEIAACDWVAPLLDWEESERARRSLKRRLNAAHIGRFKALADFDWTWPTRRDRAAIEERMTRRFLQETSNVVLVGPHGVGKSMRARNLAHQALLRGHTVLFTTAAQVLGELAAFDSDSARRRRRPHYAKPHPLVIDEVGYLSYGHRHADLMFELINRRDENKSTRVTTNRAFSEWREIFPSAACVVSLIDRLIHNAEIIPIEGESYRLKEANERSEQRAKQRKKKKS